MRPEALLQIVPDIPFQRRATPEQGFLSPPPLFELNRASLEDVYDMRAYLDTAEAAENEIERKVSVCVCAFVGGYVSTLTISMCLSILSTLNPKPQTQKTQTQISDSPTNGR